MRLCEVLMGAAVFPYCPTKTCRWIAKAKLPVSDCWVSLCVCVFAMWPVQVPCLSPNRCWYTSPQWISKILWTRWPIVLGLRPTWFLTQPNAQSYWLWEFMFIIIGRIGRGLELLARSSPPAFDRSPAPCPCRHYGCTACPSPGEGTWDNSTWVNPSQWHCPRLGSLVCVVYVK